MLVSELVLDSKKSRVRIRTFAEGLLARLAHDLELVCSDLSGRASVNERADGAQTGSATIDVPIAKIAVLGILHGEHVDEQGMSASDRSDCLDKMRKDVFHAGPGAAVHVTVVVEAGAARVRIEPPNGRAVERTVRPEITESGGGLRAKGSIDLSLAAIGSSTVKGPMNAFRVKDKVEILFDVTFYPA